MISSIQKCFVVGTVFNTFLHFFLKKIFYKKDFSLIQYEVKNALINGGIVYNLSKHNRSFLGWFNNGRLVHAFYTGIVFSILSLNLNLERNILLVGDTQHKTKHMPTRFRNRLHNIFWLIKNVIMRLLMTYKSILRLRLWKWWLSCH